MKDKKTGRTAPDPINILNEPQRAAEVAKLCYVSDEEQGYRRKPWGRGFTYIDLEGEHVKDEEQRTRFAELAIPPAWTDVWICAHSNGHLQATGRDEAGRKQYIYHPRWEEVRNQAKFNRLIHFAEALPQMRAQILKDLRRHGLPREKVLAIVVRLLEETRIRIGNAEYARRHGSRGLTTLADEHVEINGSRLYFEFVGKSGKEHKVDIRDRRLARHLKKCQDLPGQDLFQYVDAQGNCHSIGSSNVNTYLRQISGQDFTAKDFRTWAGTVLALDELYEQGPAGDDKEAERNIVDAVKSVAKALGNTPQICRSYYIHPAIIESYSTGELFAAVAEAAGEVVVDENELSTDERAVLAILRQSAGG
jgi:DNA topoisomerase-1